MMEKTALGSRSNCAAQAWPNQATGEALPNASSRKESKPQISFPRLHHSSPHAPRFDKASQGMTTSGYIGSLSEIEPRINTHRPRHTPAAYSNPFLDHRRGDQPQYALQACPAATPV
jgi:hypothetical protein